MPRTLPTTTWYRWRFTFNLADVNGDLVQDINLAQITGRSNDQVLTTSWT